MKRFSTVVLLFAGFLALVLWVLFGLPQKPQDSDAVPRYFQWERGGLTPTG
jgi:hypothetical protein